MPRPERTETEACTSLPRGAGGEVVVHVEADRPVGAAARGRLVGLVDLDVEADAPAGQPAGDAGPAAARAGAACEVVDVERDRRPAGARVRVRQDVEHGLGARVDAWWSPSMPSWPQTLPGAGVASSPEGRFRAARRDDPCPP